MNPAPAHPRPHVSRIRITDVLLVSNPYTGFLLEEAGFGPRDQPTNDDAPTFDLVRSGRDALVALESQTHQLVMIDHLLPDMPGAELAAAVRKRFPDVTALVFTDDTDLGGDRDGAAEPELNLFISYGSPSFWQALVRLAEDERNAPAQLLKGTALAILLVEDEPNFYSHFLPTLYDRIRTSAIELLPEDRRPRSDWGVSDNRPLVLLRRNFADACETLKIYERRVMALITDLRFPVDGQLDPDAGLRLLYRARAIIGHLPAVVHSRDTATKDAILDAEAKFLAKDSPRLLSELDDFLTNYCGFGPFAFCWPGSGERVGLARTLTDLRQLIAEVPNLVFEYHALHNHFSAWIAVHGYSRLARRVRDLRLYEPDLRPRVLALLDAELSTEPTSRA